jgi:aspartate-semialdehyde dehydrogenase
VGETILSILDERDFPINNLYPLASANSAGKMPPELLELLESNLAKAPDSQSSSPVFVCLFIYFYCRM